MKKQNLEMLVALERERERESYSLNNLSEEAFLL